jgi:hypothetical protein
MIGELDWLQNSIRRSLGIINRTMTSKLEKTGLQGRVRRAIINPSEAWLHALETAKRHVVERHQTLGTDVPEFGRRRKREKVDVVNPDIRLGATEKTSPEGADSDGYYRPPPLRTLNLFADKVPSLESAATQVNSALPTTAVLSGDESVTLSDDEFVVVSAPPSLA